MANHQVSRADGAAQVICRKCGVMKDQADFYAGHIRQSGEVGECKECTRARVRDRARTNPAVQAYDRARAKTPERRSHSRAIAKKWRAENPLGYQAQSAVSNAIRDGRLIRQPCLFCGREDVHAHHRDYSKPLEVIWLCPKCHHRLHAAFPEAEGDNKTHFNPEVRA